MVLLTLHLILPSSAYNHLQTGAAEQEGLGADPSLLKVGANI